MPRPVRLADPGGGAREPLSGGARSGWRTPLTMRLSDACEKLCRGGRLGCSLVGFVCGVALAAAICLETRECDVARGSEPHGCDDCHHEALTDLRAALEVLGGGGSLAAVFPLADMHTQWEADAVIGAAQLLDITGARGGWGTASRLWARFDVGGSLLLAAVTIRDQNISPRSDSDQRQGAAAHVRRRGRLVATGVSFLRLVSTDAGGAVHVDGGGVAEFYWCLFDSCQATNPCGSKVSPSGNGGAINFAAGAAGALADSTLRSGHAACAGGALFLQSTDEQQPFQAKVTISRSTFAGNRAQQGGDIKVVGGPCPAPGTACGSSCCFDGDYTSLNVTLPSG